MSDVTLLFEIAGIGIGSSVVEQIFETRGDIRVANFIKLGSTVIIIFIVMRSVNQLFDSVRTMFNL